MLSEACQHSRKGSEPPPCPQDEHRIQQWNSRICAVILGRKQRAAGSLQIPLVGRAGFYPHPKTAAFHSSFPLPQWQSWETFHSCIDINGCSLPEQFRSSSLHVQHPKQWQRLRPFLCIFPFLREMPFPNHLCWALDQKWFKAEESSLIIKSAEIHNSRTLHWFATRQGSYLVSFS